MLDGDLLATGVREPEVQLVFVPNGSELDRWIPLVEKRSKVIEHEHRRAKPYTAVPDGSMVEIVGKRYQGIPRRIRGPDDCGGQFTDERSRLLEEVDRRQVFVGQFAIRHDPIRRGRPSS